MQRGLVEQGDKSRHSQSQGGQWLVALHQKADVKYTEAHENKYLMALSICLRGFVTVIRSIEHRLSTQRCKILWQDVGLSGLEWFQVH